jgi:signal transduction histidine kinase
LHPVVIDCNSESIWRFDAALSEDCLVVELGQRASAPSIPGWPLPAEKATVLPIRLREHSEVAGFLVLGIHPGRAFDDTYREFARRIAEQIAIGLAGARAHEQERRRAEALAEIDRVKTAFFSNVSHEFRTPLALMLGPLDEVLPIISRPVGEGEIRSTTPFPTSRRRRKQRRSSSRYPSLTAKSKAGLRKISLH